MRTLTAASNVFRAIFLAALVLSCGVFAGAQSFTATHAKISLLADKATLKPGQTGWIGLYFDMEPGWHIYWTNPGDSGEPPKVQWTLPKGFRAGDFRWPAPVRLTTGSVIDYGYQGRVLLAAPVEVPADFNPSAPAKISADLRYLICREVCIPAKGHAELQLPASAADVAASDRVFAKARAEWPRPLPSGGKATATDDGKNFVLTLQTAVPETKAAFFPLEEDQIDNDAPQKVTTEGKQIRITLKKSDQLHKPLSMLNGVVVFSPDQAYQISAPVSAHR